MFRILHRIVGVVLVLLVMLISAVTFFYSAGPSTSWEAFLQMYSSQKLYVCWFAVGMLLLVTLYLLTAIRSKDRDRYMTFPNEGGTLSVSLRGVSTFISKLGHGIDGIAGLRARVVPGRNVIDVVLDVKVQEGVQIHEVSQLLQQNVRDGLKETVGITEVRNVVVNVKEIVPRHRLA